MAKRGYLGKSLGLTPEQRQELAYGVVRDRFDRYLPNATPDQVELAVEAWERYEIGPAALATLVRGLADAVDATEEEESR
jgi:hypothetical protein